jgi:hypothetical protein
MLRGPLIVGFMASRASKPESANGLRKALRALMKHAVAERLRSDDPTQGIKSVATKNKRGFHTWTDAEIDQFKVRHAEGSKPRKAMQLGRRTRQARQDVIKMGPQHIREEVLSWVRGKTATPPRKRVPVAGNEERPLPDARGPVPGGAERQ